MKEGLSKFRHFWIKPKYNKIGGTLKVYANRETKVRLWQKFVGCFSHQFPFLIQR
jgi:hypothetical protein